MIGHHTDTLPLLLIASVVLVAGCAERTSPNLPPSVQIVEGNGPLSRLVGDTLRLHAIATDPRDGTLPGDAIVWWGPGDTRLGEGDSLVLRLDAEDVFVVTARATDREGLTAEDAIEVVVAGNTAPTVKLTSIRPWAGVYVTDQVTMVATAADAETGPPAGATVTWTSSLQGSLGTGDTLVLARGALQLGAHLITVRASDPQGNSGSDSATVRVLLDPTRLVWSRLYQHPERDIPDNAPQPGGQPRSYPQGTVAVRDDGVIVLGVGPTAQNCDLDAGGCLFALSPQGQVQWQASFPELFWIHSSGVTVAPDGSVFAFDFAGNGFAFDPGGALRWASQILGFDAHGRLALGADGALYAIGFAGFDAGSVIRRISPTDGTVMWELSSDSKNYHGGGIVAPDGQVVAQFHDTVFWASPQGAVNLKVGSVDGSGNYQGAMDEPGTLYLSNSRELNAIAPDGSLSWSVPFPDTPTEPVIDADGTLFAATMWGGTVVKAVDAGGSVVWETAVEPGYWPHLALTVDHVLYVSSDFCLTALSTIDGSVRWQSEFASTIYAGPAVAPDGTVYVVTYDYRLLALRGDGPPDPNAPWPAWRGNSRRTASVRR